MLLLKLLDLLTIVTAETELVLLRCAMIIGIQAQLARLLDDLFEAELGHVVGDSERHLPFDMGLGVDDVDLLKLTAGRLDIEEIDKSEFEKIPEHEEDVKPIADLARLSVADHIALIKLARGLYVPCSVRRAQQKCSQIRRIQMSIGRLPFPWPSCRLRAPLRGRSAASK